MIAYEGLLLGLCGNHDLSDDFIRRISWIFIGYQLAVQYGHKARQLR